MWSRQTDPQHPEGHCLSIGIMGATAERLDEACTHHCVAAQVHPRVMALTGGWRLGEGGTGPGRPQPSPSTCAALQRSNDCLGRPLDSDSEGPRPRVRVGAPSPPKGS